MHISASNVLDAILANDPDALVVFKIEITTVPFNQSRRREIVSCQMLMVAIRFVTWIT
jgi:hypothetical protein